VLLAVRGGPARQALGVLVVTALSPAEHAIHRRLAAAALAAGEPILAVQVAKVVLLTGLAVGLVSAAIAMHKLQTLGPTVADRAPVVVVADPQLQQMVFPESARSVVPAHHCAEATDLRALTAQRVALGPVPRLALTAQRACLE
jgi:hypothetical protein